MRIIRSHDFSIRRKFRKSLFLYFSECTDRIANMKFYRMPVNKEKRVLVKEEGRRGNFGLPGHEDSGTRRGDERREYFPSLACFVTISCPMSRMFPFI